LQLKYSLTITLSFTCYPNIIDGIVDHICIDYFFHRP
jgi:hypothetical protein